MNGDALLPLSVEAIEALVTGRRWFSASEEPVISVTPLAIARIFEDPRLTLLVAEVRHANGQHERYQLLLSDPPPGQPGVVLGDGLPVVDAVDRPEIAGQLLSLIAAQAECAATDGVFRFASGGDPALTTPGEVHSLGRDQSHSALIADGQLFVKIYRRLLPGPSPELEILRHLQTVGFAAVPDVSGWWAYGDGVTETTLGVVLQYLHDPADGVDLAKASAATGTRDEAFAVSMGQLGTVTAALHRALADDRGNLAFTPEPLGSETVPLLTATLDDALARVALLRDATDMAATAEALRGRLRALDHPPDAGMAIRTHGDLHLGQTLLSRDGWYLVDFEGEPLRDHGERRRKRSPLRDVAGLLRSIDYAATSAEREDGARVHPDWAPNCRSHLLSAYRAGMRGADILPDGLRVVEELLFLFEVEKVLYELDYDRAHRPGRVEIALGGLRALAAAQ